MIKRITMVVLMLFAFGCLSWAASKSWTGTVSDEHCGAKHAKASADAETCVEKCVSGGAKYVLVSKGKVYQVDAQDKFQGLGGKSVKVTGSLSDSTITVAEVSPVGGK
ncbi:MAG: hypothetical protein ABSE93_13515 [Terriglobia bacterium]|jgi:hypothetical protein